jgi:hypothetical protein
MKYCGNYNHLIKSEWIDLLLKTKGIPISPWKDHKDDEVEEEIDFDQLLTTTQDEKDLFLNGAYDENLIMAEMFNEENIPFELDLKELQHLLVGDWWIVKQLPGQFMPIHRDTAIYYEENNRIWMPLIDYKKGHIFIHEGKFVKDYKAGDMFKYNKDNDLHGSINLSNIPRLVLQISQKIIPYEQ